MAITVVPSVVTGQTYSAANFNTHVRDNINGIWVLTTAGDMLYATGASAAARLALVTGGVMIGGASAPSWLTLVVGGILKGGASAPEWLANVAGGLLKGGASAPAYLALGAKHKFLKSNGTDVVYGSPVYKRTGGDATNWQSTGTTVYEDETFMLLCGVGSISINPLGTQDITFAEEFSGRPHIYILANATGCGVVANYLNDSTTGFTAQLYRPDGGSGSFSYNWFAFGEKN